jgi:hypothetical protein
VGGVVTALVFDSKADVIAACDGLVHALSAIAQDVEGRDDPDHLALLLDALRRVKAAVGEAYQQCEAQLVACMGTKSREVPGLGVIEVKFKVGRRKWDHDGLWRVVVARAHDERRVDGDGVYESEGEAVARVLAECCRPDWRLTPLRARSIDPDEFSETTPAGWSVVLPPREVA